MNWRDRGIWRILYRFRAKKLENSKKENQMLRKLATLMTLLVIVGLVMTACAPQTPEEQIGKRILAQEVTATLEAERAQYSATEPLNFRFTLTNNSDRTLSVLKWNTPLEGFNSDMFLVERDGEPVIYLGRTVKRGVPKPEDYVTIGPGESVSTVFDLGESYAIFEAGEYSVQYTSRILDIGVADPEELAAKRELISEGIQSNVATFRLLESKTPPAM